MKSYIQYIVLIFGLVVSCDLFQPRDSEDPIISRANYIAATTPDILFSNLISAFDEKFTDNYIRSFVDTTFLSKKFRFIPSAASVAQYNILTQWDLRAERQYFDKIRTIPAEGAGIRLTLLNENSNLQGDSAIFSYDYNIILPTSDESIPSLYQGSSQFKIYLDSRNQWVIGEWEDTKLENTPSWSDLKGRFY